MSEDTAPNEAPRGESQSDRRGLGPVPWFDLVMRLNASVFVLGLFSIATLNSVLRWTHRVPGHPRPSLISSNPMTGNTEFFRGYPDWAVIASGAALVLVFGAMSLWIVGTQAKLRFRRKAEGA